MSFENENKYENNWFRNMYDLMNLILYLWDCEHEEEAL